MLCTSGEIIFCTMIWAWWWKQLLASVISDYFLLYIVIWARRVRGRFISVHWLDVSAVRYEGGREHPKKTNFVQ